MPRLTIAGLQAQLEKRDELLVEKSERIEQLEVSAKNNEIRVQELTTQNERLVNELRAALMTLKNMGRLEV